MASLGKSNFTVFVILFMKGFCRQVFGVPDERMGEEVVLWYRPRSGSTLNEESLKEWSKEKVTRRISLLWIISIAQSPSFKFLSFTR